MADDAPTIRVLSAGAPQTGVVGCADAFTRSGGPRLDLEFATAPEIRRRMEQGGAGLDVVVAPVRAIAEFERAGRLARDGRARIGDVRAGVAVRSGAPRPDIATSEALKRAILNAGSVIYNEASSGQYIRTMMEGLGIAEAVAARTRLFPSAGAAMTHLGRDGTDRDIAFGQIPAIRRLEDRGVALVGPLPDALQNITSYAAALTAGANDRARAFVDFLAGPEARSILAAAGIE